MRIRFTHLHSSGKYNALAGSLHRAMFRYTARAQLITLTEVDRESREDALKHDNFTVLTSDHGAKDDCAIVYDNRVFKHIHHEAHLVGSHLFKFGGHWSSPLWAQIAVLEHLESGKRIVVGVCHFPSGVETDLYHKRFTDRVVAWWQSVRNLKSRMNELKAHYEAEGAILSADWNINFKKKWARTVVKIHAPLWDLVWSKARLPKAGTHGLRLIDAAILRGFRVISARVEVDDNSSDHRPWSEFLSL